MTIGETIKRLRKKRGWSQNRLALETELSRSYVHYVEQDRVLPSAEKLRAVIEALGAEAGPVVRQRDEIELGRLNVDAHATLMLKEEFGELTDEELAAVVRLVRRRRRAPAGGAR